jgi:organic hydroperoxide reductase OsmC/OhrA
MKGEPVKHNYQTSLRWTDEKKGILSCDGKPDINVACPPEFGGHPGIWSPEDIFLASVEICIMTTFLWYVNKENLSLKSYDSKASGTVEMSGGVFQFSSITIKVRIGISSEDDRSRVEKMMKKVERACLITNSIRTDVNIESDISR